MNRFLLGARFLRTWIALRVGNRAHRCSTAHERSFEMFTAKQYRAKAAEYREYLNASRSPAETSEFRKLEQTYTTLADNEEWLAL